MENASKALIIAGAILLAILLISLGMLIFTQAQDQLGKGGLDKAATESFNNAFLKYERTNVRGSEVKSLINEAIASNADEANQDMGAIVKIVYNDGTTDKTLVDESTHKSGDISTNKRYDIVIDKYDNGRVDTIKITETNSSSSTTT